MGFIEKHAGGLFQKFGSNKLVARAVARGVSKDSFLLELEEAWSSTISKYSDVDEELRNATDRIKKSGYEGVFKQVGVTEDDLRQVIISIKERKAEPVKVEHKVGRNDPCPCGSGKKYKHCCGM